MTSCRKCALPLRSANDGKVMVCIKCGYELQVGAEPKPKVQKQGPLNEKLPSEGEVSFMEAFSDYYPSLPFETEYKFHDFREWRLDFCWPLARLAVEMESSVHRTKGRFDSDIPKYNALAQAEWVLYRTTKSALEKDAERFCRMVAEHIRRRLGNVQENQ